MGSNLEDVNGDSLRSHVVRPLLAGHAVTTTTSTSNLQYAWQHGIGSSAMHYYRTRNQYPLQTVPKQY
jgi:hypothetical protein